MNIGSSDYFSCYDNQHFLLQALQKTEANIEDSSIGTGVEQPSIPKPL